MAQPWPFFWRTWQQDGKVFPVYDPGNETATITAKGQITLPKVIRQALGVDYVGKVAFDLQNGRVVVSRDEAIHEDPAITGFLAMFERDIQSGRHTGPLPEGLASAMARSLKDSAAVKGPGSYPDTPQP
jgi:antitoxin PrlF